MAFLSKTEYIECNFSNERELNEELVTLEGKEMFITECFKYLRLILQRNAYVDQGVAHRN